MKGCFLESRLSHLIFTQHQNLFINSLAKKHSFGLGHLNMKGKVLRIFIYCNSTAFGLDRLEPLKRYLFMFSLLNI